MKRYYLYTYARYLQSWSYYNSYGSSPALDLLAEIESAEGRSVIVLLSAIEISKNDHDKLEDQL